MSRNMKKSISQKLAMLLCLAMVITMIPVTASAATKLTAQQIVERANYLYNFTWTAQKTITGHTNSNKKVSYTFYKGNTYHLPYGMPVNNGVWIGYGISPESFVQAAGNVNNVFYTKRAYYNEYGCTYYAMDCSAFVSYCWGIGRNTTYSLPDCSQNLGACNYSNLNNVQIGDALNSDAHVVLVTGVNRDANGNVSSIEITQETPPQLKRGTLSRSSVASSYGGYTILRYAEGSVNPSPSLSRTIDSRYPTPMKAYPLAESGNITVYEESGSIASGRYICYNDLCDILEVYTDGMCKVRYPVSNGTRIQLARLSDFIESGTTPYAFTASQYMATYQKRNMATAFGNIDAGDNCTVVRERDGIAQIIYPISGGYKLGWAWYTPKAAIETGNAVVFTDNNFYAQIEMKNSKRVLTEDGNGNVMLSENKSQANQLWKFVKQADESYAIISAMTGNMMDVYDGGIGSSTNVITYPANGGANQHFNVYQFSDGTFRFEPAHASGMSLDISGAADSDGANLQIYANHADFNQRFKVYTISNTASFEPKIHALKFYKDEDFKQQITSVSKGDVIYMGTDLLENVNNVKFTLYADGNVLMDGYTENLNFRWVVPDSNVKTYKFVLKASNALGSKTVNSTLDVVEKVQKVDISKCIVTLGTSSYTYDGTEKKPSVTVKSGSTTLKKGTDYTLQYNNNINAGIATVKVIGAGNYQGSISKNFTINKAQQEIKISSSGTTVKVGKALGLSASAKGKITYTLSNPSVASIDNEMILVGTAPGEVTITFTAAETSNYKSATKSLKVTVVNDNSEQNDTSNNTYYDEDEVGEYDDSDIELDEEEEKEIVLEAPSNVKLSNSTNGPSIKWSGVIGAEGYYVWKKISGTDWQMIGTVTNGTSYTDYGSNCNGSVYTYRVNAFCGKVQGDFSKEQSITYLTAPELKSLKNASSGKMSLKVSTNMKATGFEIQYSNSSSFTKAKTGRTSTASTGSWKIKNLSNETYYVRVRVYKKSGSSIYRSAWSSTKSVKVTK